MPIYEYKVRESLTGCPYCHAGFELMRKLSDPPLLQCPRCGAEVAKQYSVPTVGRSTAGFDDRARHAGFHKLKRLGHGEYEKQY